ncbi:MAG: hypothetical protein P4L22_07855 [Candidatus Babeliales bacterium]|nr:hypothetical protein [Candidatus Babeliales bacterium]
MSYCIYYQAKVNKAKTWFFVATLRSFENLCFDRTFSVQDEVFELLVPEGLEPDFLKIMKYYQDNLIVTNLEKLPNRYESN